VPGNYPSLQEMAEVPGHCPSFRGDGGGARPLPVLCRRWRRCPTTARLLEEMVEVPGFCPSFAGDGGGARLPVLYRRW
jgi:hypothetical protein